MHVLTCSATAQNDNLFFKGLHKGPPEAKTAPGADNQRSANAQVCVEGTGRPGLAHNQQKKT